MADNDLPTTPDTRQKLLDAAVEVFAEYGFHQATVRDITRRAGVSLALVNYHFRDKAELYAAVIRRLLEESSDVIPGDEIMTGEPAGQLRRFVEQFLHRALDPSAPSWRRMIFFRELAQPTAAFDSILEMARPLYGRLGRIVASLAAKPLSDDQIALYAAGVLGQCLYYLEHDAIIKAIQPELADRRQIQRICDHIVTSTLAALANPAGFAPFSSPENQLDKR